MMSETGWAICTPKKPKTLERITATSPKTRPNRQVLIKVAIYMYPEVCSI